MESTRWTSIATSFLLVLVVGCGADSEGDTDTATTYADAGGGDTFTGGSDATTTDTTDEQVTEEELDSAMASACAFCRGQNPMLGCPAEQTVENLLKSTIAMSKQFCGEILVEEYWWLNNNFRCAVDGGGSYVTTCEVVTEPDVALECDQRFNHVPLDDPYLTLFPGDQRFVDDPPNSTSTTCQMTTDPRPSGW